MRNPSLQQSKQRGNDTEKFTNLAKEKERFHMESGPSKMCKEQTLLIKID